MVNQAEKPQKGRQGTKTRGVALYMDSNTEELGIAFCNDAPKNVQISPGLSALLNGSTRKITLRRKVYDQMPPVNVENCVGRIVRKYNKTIVLFPMRDHITAFEQACAVLTEIGGRGSLNTQPRRISVDAMTVGYLKGEAKDYEGVLLASKYHEIVVYEDRGQDLGHLLPRNDQPTAPTVRRDQVTAEQEESGSERLQRRAEEEESSLQRTTKAKVSATTSVKKSLEALGRAFFQNYSKGGKTLRRLISMPSAANTKQQLDQRSRSEPPACPSTSKGQFPAPTLRPAKGAQDHIINAFLEFTALAEATLKVNTETCENILQNYNRSTWGMPISTRVLWELLEEAEAAVYDNNRARVLAGNMSGSYMAAYSGSSGFVSASKTGRLFNTPPEDPVVVVAKCTRVMLEGEVLTRAKTMASESLEGAPPGSWADTAIEWVNGVPGCGKTEWVTSRIDIANDIAITTTLEAANDLRERLALRKG
ncbi:hypothetical protein ACJJTC_012468, partial [Scirpophaga incertulas]